LPPSQRRQDGNEECSVLEKEDDSLLMLFLS
jgi:hypothetical protein